LTKLNRYFMFTYITTTTIPSFPQLQKLYNITYPQVSWTVATPSIGLSLSPFFWSPMADIYGRRLVFLVGTVIALAATIGTAVSKTYATYTIARFSQGFGVSPGGIVGMAIIGECV
jgi:MFS family permease